MRAMITNEAVVLQSRVRDCSSRGFQTVVLMADIAALDRNRRNSAGLCAKSSWNLKRLLPLW